MAALQPARKIELLAMFAIGVDPNVSSAFRPEQMHRIGDHHGAFIEVVSVVADGFAHAIGRRRQRSHEIERTDWGTVPSTNRNTRR